MREEGSYLYKYSPIHSRKSPNRSNGMEPTHLRIITVSSTLEKYNRESSKEYSKHIMGYKKIQKYILGYKDS